MEKTPINTAQVVEREGEGFVILRNELRFNVGFSSNCVFLRM